jgi:putative methyltransferase (TIGR04325 family)
VVRKLLRLIKDMRLYFRFPHRCYGCFRGVFTTFDEAISAAPKTKPLGDDDPRLAQEYRQTLDKQAREYDYPVLFWLKDLMGLGTRVFDLGGNVGIHFYTYEKYLRYPPGLRWTVCDVPAIVKAGEELARTEGRRELTFTTRFEDADGAHIFIASGSIQYISSISDLLSSLSAKPGHLLLNRLPLCDGEQFVTLQNGGQVFYPQYVFNKDEFIDSVRRLGYKLVDVWDDRIDFPSIIPFHPSKSPLRFYGLYFKWEP